MIVFTGWMVNGKLQKDPPEEFLQKVREAFEEVCGVKLIPKE